jgi:DNA ligase-1
MEEEEHQHVASLQALCHITQVRARELLEAASGSLERAVDIHFSSAESTGLLDGDPVASAVTMTNLPPEGERPPRQAPPPSKATNSPAGKKRQSTLHYFMGLPVPNEPKEAKEPKQQKIDSFFASPKGKASPSTASPHRGNLNESETIRVKKEADKSQLKVEAIPSIKHESTELAREELQATKHVAKVATTEELSRAPDSSSPNSTPLPYSLLATHFAEMVSTTKRTAKLESLQSIFRQVIESVGGIQEERARDDDAVLLTSAIDLILGKLSMSKKGATREHLTLQVSGTAVSTAVQAVTGASRAQMREEYRNTGDLGDVASKYFVAASVKSFFKSRHGPTVLSIREVHEMMQSVATVSNGKGSQAARQNLLVRLLRGCQDKNEIRFLVRTLCGNMRLGATIKSVIAALAGAVGSFGGASADKDLVKTLQDTFNVCPRFYDIAKALLEGGVLKASRVCSLVVGHPIQPMLANPAHSLDEVNTFMGNHFAVAEWKYDGVRCQAHFDSDKGSRVFSRHLIESTAQYPDAVQHLLEAKRESVQSFIVDAEIVAVAPVKDCDGGGYQLLPFQDLSTRRSVNTGSKSDRIAIRLYSYDLMYLNGKSLLREPLWKRQNLLRDNFRETSGFGFAMSTAVPSFDKQLLQKSLKVAVEGGAEGLMIKLTGQEQNDTQECEELGKLHRKSFGYESGTRSRLWLKLKRDYITGSADTIDVVPIGAWYGNGRKAQAGFLSPVLLAVYDEDEDVFRSISRCMSFTDDMYRATREFYFRGTPYPANVDASDESLQALSDGSKSGHESMSEDSESVRESDDERPDPDRKNCFPGRPSSAEYVTNESPPIWFKPLEVWEVTFADLTLSRTHTAATGLVGDEEGRGVAMRFPRFKRRRPDKSIKMATTSAQIAHLFRSQTKIANR